MKSIKQYIRRGNEKIGLLLAYTTGNDEVKVSYSLCHKNDKFDPKEAEVQARMKGEDVDIPNSIRREFEEFIVRAMRYFRSIKITGPKGTAEIAALNILTFDELKKTGRDGIYKSVYFSHRSFYVIPSVNRNVIVSVGQGAYEELETTPENRFVFHKPFLFHRGQFTSIVTV